MYRLCFGRIKRPHTVRRCTDGSWCRRQPFRRGKCPGMEPLCKSQVFQHLLMQANLKPIHSAILRDAEETALFLLSKGADPNTECVSVAPGCCLRSDAATRISNHHCAQDEGFPLRMAIRANMTALAKAIIKHGGNVHIKDKVGWSYTEAAPCSHSCLKSPQCRADFAQYTLWPHPAM
jgi:hypothetical protein